PSSAPTSPSASVQAEPGVAPEAPTVPWPGAFTPSDAAPRPAGVRPAESPRVTPPAPNGLPPAPQRGAGRPRGQGHRHRKHAGRRPALTKLPRKARLVAALAVVAGALVVGFADGGFGGESSAEPAVQTFLLEWQNAHYAQAAAL